MTSGKKGKTVWKIISLLVAAAVLAFGLIIAFICVQENNVAKKADDLKNDFDAIIVLGAQVKPDGMPSVQLSWRLNAAVEIWNKKRVPVVVCGAKGMDEPEAEAFAMKRYLEERGISSDSILTDPDSFNTRENLLNAKTLLNRYPDEINRIVIVTSDYHVPRAMALARDFGMEAYGIGSPCLQEFWIKNHGREALAWCKYWANKYLHLNL